MTNWYWKFEYRLPDGHRLFSTMTEDGIKYVIADDSGRTPEETDDGVLYLDSSRCLIVDSDESCVPAREALAIPLIDGKGRQTRTPTNTATLLHLAHLLKWMVQNETTKEVYEIR